MTPQEKWNALPDSSRQTLLKRHRDTNVSDNWWEDTYEGFRSVMDDCGVSVDEIYFSGFWNQGDGACFEGNVSDWPKFLEAFQKWDESNNIPDLPKLQAFLEEHGVPTMSWSHFGRYYHKRSVSFNTDDLAVTNPFDDDTDPLRYAMWVATYGQDGMLVALEKPFIDFLRDQMQDLYDRLEAEYEYLTSDEVIAQYIQEYGEDEIDDCLGEEAEELELSI